MVAVNLGGVAMANPDTNGVRWHVADIVGLESPPIRAEVFTIPGVAGGNPGQWTDDPRALSIRGVLYAPSETLMWQAIDSVNAVLPRGSDLTLTVTSVLRAITLGYRVAPGATPLLHPLTDQAAEFDLPLLCLDPRKHGTTTHTLDNYDQGDSGPLTATQAGTFERTPPDSMTITGSAGGATNVHVQNVTDGPTLVYTHAIGAGEVLTFDFRAGTVTSSVSGDVTTRLDPTSRWWDLLAGANTIHYWTDGGAVTMHLSWRDAWK